MILLKFLKIFLVLCKKFCCTTSFEKRNFAKFCKLGFTKFSEIFSKITQNYEIKNCANIAQFCFAKFSWPPWLMHWSCWVCCNGVSWSQVLDVTNSGILANSLQDLISSIHIVFLYDLVYLGLTVIYKICQYKGNPGEYYYSVVLVAVWNTDMTPNRGVSIWCTFSSHQFQNYLQRTTLTLGLCSLQNQTEITNPPWLTTPTTSRTPTNTKRP
jgi:hypothetical protein